MSQDNLRQRAEVQLGEEPQATPEQSGELQRLVHELRVHQIELELQNEELRQAQDALKESEARYRLLSDLASECIFWIGPEGRYRYVSPAFQTITGHEVEELLAHPELMVAMIHPDDRELYRRHLDNPRKADVGELEFRIIREDGTERWVGHDCRPIFSVKGEFLGRRGANRDITERKRALQQVLKLSRVIEQSSESIIVTDLDARIEFVNAAFERQTGYTQAEVRGRNPRLLKTNHTPPETFVAHIEF